MLQFCTQSNNGHAIFTVAWVILKEDSSCAVANGGGVMKPNIQQCQKHCVNAGFTRLTYSWETDCDCCSESSELRDMEWSKVYQGKSFKA